MTIKKSVQTKYRLPVLNWVAMKPNQVKGTVFSELDDEKLYTVIDFCRFEEMFKLGRITITDTTDGNKFDNRKTLKRETISLLETNRLRNVGKFNQ